MPGECRAPPALSTHKYGTHKYGIRCRRSDFHLLRRLSLDSIPPSRIVRDTSFIPGLYDVCMVF
jgi:hypothetical protein